MDALDFVKKDMAKNSRRPRWLTGIFAGGVFLLPVLMGIFLKQDLKGVFTARTLIPNVAAALFLVLAALTILKRGSRARGLYTLLGAALLLATERVVFPLEPRTVYETLQIFWAETAKCFAKGSLATTATGIWMVFFAFTISAWPTRTSRILISFLTGVSGVIMLGFHCDSSAPTHVLVGHLGPGVVLGIVIFLIQEVIFRSALKKNFPGLRNKVGHFSRIG